MNQLQGMSCEWQTESLWLWLTNLQNISLIAVISTRQKTRANFWHVWLWGETSIFLFVQLKVIDYWMSTSERWLWRRQQITLLMNISTQLLRSSRVRISFEAISMKKSLHENSIVISKTASDTHCIAARTHRAMRTLSRDKNNRRDRVNSILRTAKTRWCFSKWGKLIFASHLI